MGKSKNKRTIVPIMSHLKGKAKRKAVQTEEGSSYMSFIKPKSKFHD